MNLKNPALFLFLALLSGCLAPMQKSQVIDGVIVNPSFGMAYDIPEVVTLYTPETPPPDAPLQQMALRIHELNRQMHPSGDEVFYEGFLMFSEQAAFLLVMVERTGRIPVDDWEWAADRMSAKPLLPFYNVEASSALPLNDGRMPARLTTGVAYERKGWYYSRSKPGRTTFSYEACTFKGLGSDQTILMGISFPENRHILAIQMQEMIRGFRF